MSRRIPAAAALLALLLALWAVPAMAMAAAAELPVRVTVSGGAPSVPETFTLTLRAASDGAPLPEGAAGGAYTLTVDGGGAVTLRIPCEKAGKYRYTLCQEPGKLARGQYDHRTYYITVTVTEDGRVTAAVYGDAAQEGDKYLSCDEKARHDALAQFGLSRNIPKMKTDLARYGIQYDQWFFESTLHESGYVADSVQLLTDRGWTYEKDGALWLKTAEILSEKLRAAGKSDADIEKLALKDDVLRRANGFYTYFAADIAYHRNKFAVRGFDKVVNIWGADHHGHVARLKGAMDALGLDGEHRLDIVLMQLVKLVRDGGVVRMSKRTGKAISLTDLLDEIPVDACRWFFNAKPDTQMEFDLGLAVREDSENPVYYVQYAYARICTLLKALAAEGYDVPAAADADLALLTADEEKALIKQLAQYPVVVRLAARDYDPSFINRYLSELAAAFHKFYNACRIKGEEKNVLLARLKLADTARAVLKNGMTLIGCSAPEKM